MASVIYLDTNAVSNLVRGSLAPTSREADTLHALCRAARRGDVELLYSVALLDELTSLGVSDWRLYLEIVDVLMAQGQLLRSTMDLARAEIDAGGGLKTVDLYERRAVRRELLREYQRPRFVRGRAREVSEISERFKAEEEQRRLSVRAAFAEHYPGKSIAKISRQWWAESEQLIRTWIRESWEATPDAFGLSSDSTRWPDPTDIPSVWSMFAYKMARIHLNNGENRRIDATDHHDAHHYVAASHAQYLVTDDGRFRATCEMIPSTSFAVVGLDGLPDLTQGR